MKIGRGTMLYVPAENLEALNRVLEEAKEEIEEFNLAVQESPDLSHKLKLSTICLPAQAEFIEEAVLEALRDFVEAVYELLREGRHRVVKARLEAVKEAPAAFVAAYRESVHDLLAQIDRDVTAVANAVDPEGTGGELDLAYLENSLVLFGGPAS